MDSPYKHIDSIIWRTNNGHWIDPYVFIFLFAVDAIALFIYEYFGTRNNPGLNPDGYQGYWVSLLFAQ